MRMKIQVWLKYKWTRTQWRWSRDASITCVWSIELEPHKNIQNNLLRNDRCEWCMFLVYVLFIRLYTKRGVLKQLHSPTHGRRPNERSSVWQRKISRENHVTRDGDTDYSQQADNITERMKHLEVFNRKFTVQYKLVYNLKAKFVEPQRQHKMVDTHIKFKCRSIEHYKLTTSKIKNFGHPLFCHYFTSH